MHLYIIYYGGYKAACILQYDSILISSVYLHWIIIVLLINNNKMYGHINSNNWGAKK